MTIKKRPDFVRLFTKGRYAAKSGLVVQAILRPEEEKAKYGDAVRVGFTATKKIGHAVVRNRSKRRLRALCAEILPQYAVAGADYNFIARASTPTADFDSLRADAAAALKRLRSDLTTVRENENERA